MTSRRWRASSELLKENPEVLMTATEGKCVELNTKPRDYPRVVLAECLLSVRQALPSRHGRRLLIDEGEGYDMSPSPFFKRGAGIIASLGVCLLIQRLDVVNKFSWRFSAV